MALEEIVFPNNIRNIRIAKGMKMTALAENINMSLSAVSKIEKGVRKLNQKQLLLFCKVLDCKLSDIFIKDSDKTKDYWEKSIKDRIKNNESNGLKIFGNGIKRIRRNKLKTIVETANDAGLTLSVYHKIETGQREITKKEIDLLAKSFNYTTEELFDEIANLYKSGELDKSYKKESIKMVAGINLASDLYNSKLYDGALKNLVPVLGKSENDNSFISLKKTDESFIISSKYFNSYKNMYAISVNSDILGGIFNDKTYFIIDSSHKVNVGDTVLAVDKDFIFPDDNLDAKAVICKLCKSSDGKLYGFLNGKEYKYKIFHKVLMIIM